MSFREPFCHSCGSHKVKIKDGAIECFKCGEKFLMKGRPISIGTCGLCDKDITQEVYGWERESDKGWQSEPYYAPPMHTFMLCKECKKKWRKMK